VLISLEKENAKAGPLGYAKICWVLYTTADGSSTKILAVATRVPNWRKKQYSIAIL
jgi:hypothetical protein